MKKKSAKFYSRMYAMEIMDEQDFTGYVADTGSWCITRKTGRNAREAGIRPVDIGLFYQKDIQNIVSQMADVVPDVDTVIQNHTRIPLFKPFLSTAQINALYRYHAIGEVTDGLPIRRVTSQMAFCPDCYEMDMDELGYSYWRRGPRIAGLMACDKHSKTLLSYCPTCFARHQFTDKLWELDMKCICKKRRLQVARLGTQRLAAATDVAMLAAMTLRGKQPTNLSGPNLVNAVRHHLKKRDLVGIHAGSFLQNLLNRTWGEEIATKLGINSWRFSISAAGAHLGLPYPEHPIQAMTVVQAVFGDFELYSQTVQEAENEPPFQGFRLLVSSQPALPSEIKAWRAWLRQIVKEYPEVTRTELMGFSGYKKHRSCMRWDAGWYDRILPSKPNFSDSNIQARRNPDAEKIKELKRHIAERHRYIIEHWPLKRIYAGQLCANAAHGKANVILNSPEIQDTLAKYVDTDQTFARRCFKHFRPLILQHPNSCVMAKTSWWLKKKSVEIGHGIAYTQRWLKRQQKQPAGSR